ncbi:MAG: hypothetical protein CL701_06210 [Chloroflexi bacterium]|nr:hypothetical protein [Chloroflexota bacterium]
MAGAIDKKIIEIKDELDNSPRTHLSARTGILDSVTLLREFSQTRLNALCEAFTGGKNESGVSTNMSLHTVCQSLAAQRLICYGAGSIKGNATGIKKFNLPAYETVNGALSLTEPNTSFMGINATDISETYTINLTTLAGTQTQGENTFSTDVRDYYLARSRVTGELIEISDDITPYSTPDQDTPFGNAVAWGDDVGSEAGTWNADFAKVNIASVATQSEGLYNELDTMTLQDHLTQGSNSQYTTIGAAFGQKFYLKRHADHVNTFTITGTTTVGSIEVTEISETDLTKIKYGDVISGTGIPDDNVTIAAVRSADSKIRLSNSGIATTDGTITLTVNSVPFGYQKNDIFCQIEVVGEGLVINQNWRPVGDDAGDYSTADDSPHKLLNANTSQFVGLLGFFDPDNGSANATNDLTKGARGDWVSEGKEYNETSYPYVENNPFFPAIGGTHKAYEVDNSEIVGIQPTGLGEDDIPSGRYVRWDVKRADEDGALPEHRYIIDSAEKFYYEPQANGALATIGSATSIASHSMPNDDEPRASFPRTGLGSVVTLVRQDQTLAASTNGSQSIVPVDEAMYNPTPNSTTGSVPSTQTAYNYRVSSGVIKRGGYSTTYSGPTHNSTGGTTNPTAGFNSSGRSAISPTDYVIVSNYAARKLTTDGSTTNADVAFITGVIDELQGTTAGGAKFRDPIMEGVSTKHMTSASANDASFDTYICATTGTNAVDTALADIKSSLTAFYSAAEMSSRSVTFAGGDTAWGSLTAQDDGTQQDFDNFSSQNGHAKWVTFSTTVGTLQTNLDNRIAEIDARIGKPTRSGSPSTSRGTPPAVYVSAVPTANSTGGYAPYGRAIYDSCNYLLGKDLKLMTDLIQSIQSLGQLVELVKKARNKYEIYNGRGKEY